MTVNLIYFHKLKYVCPLHYRRSKMATGSRHELLMQMKHQYRTFPLLSSVYQPLIYTQGRHRVVLASLKICLIV